MKKPKHKAQYVDGFVFVVPKKNFSKYRKMAVEAGKVWIKFGALEYIEAKGEDMHPPQDPKMKTNLFPKLVKQKKGEEVWFSFITFKSRKHRDVVNAKVMKEFEKKYADKKDMAMPFETSRMAYGGFKIIVNS